MVEKLIEEVKKEDSRKVFDAIKPVLPFAGAVAGYLLGNEYGDNVRGFMHNYWPQGPGLIGGLASVVTHLAATVATLPPVTGAIGYEAGRAIKNPTDYTLPNVNPFRPVRTAGNLASRMFDDLSDVAKMAYQGARTAVKKLDPVEKR